MISTPIVAGQAAESSTRGLSTELLAFAGDQPIRWRASGCTGAHLTLPGDNPTLHLYGGLGGLTSQIFAADNRAIYLFGRATHPITPGDQLLSWCNEQFSPRKHAQYRDLHGLFVLIIDDRRTHEVTFISDILGIRPWFVGAHKGRLVAGSNVLSICKAGLSEGKVNYDEVSSWLRYNQPTDSASVVTDYRCMKPATLATYRADGSLVREECYGALDFGHIEAPSETVIEETFNAISDSIKTLTRGLGEVNLPLSGGYDSRLVTAIASQLPSLQSHLCILKTREYELDLARQVAAALGQPLQELPTRKRILDLFDDPFCLTPGGFITGRNLTSHIARLRPGVPLLSGFMGDGVMRGGLLEKSKIYFAKDEENLSVDDITAAIDKRYRLHGNRLELLSDPVRKRVDERAIASMRKVAAAGIHCGRPTVYSDLFCRNRFYYSNIILQHLDVAEGLAPFVNFRSMNARVKYHHTCFDHESYPKLFAKYFPQLKHIPHSIPAENKLHQTKKAASPATRHLRRWSADVAAGLLLTNILDGAKKKKIFTLLPSGLLGEPLYQDEITFIYKLMIFERTLQKHGIDFDWEQI